MSSTNDKIYVYNPDIEDFSVEYDINENGQPVRYTLHAKEAEPFVPVIANHIKHHLAKHLMFKRGIKINAEQDIMDIMKELEVDLNSDG